MNKSAINIKYALLDIFKNKFIFTLIILQLIVSFVFGIIGLKEYIAMNKNMKRGSDIYDFKNSYMSRINTKENNDHSYDKSNATNFLSFKNYMENAVEFEYLNYYSNGLYIDNIINDNLIYYNEFIKNEEDVESTVMDVNGKKYIGLKGLEVNFDFINNTNYNIISGRNLNVNDFSNNYYEDALPIIMGHDYMKYYKIGDTFNALDVSTKKENKLEFDTIKVEIVGFLEEEKSIFKEGFSYIFEVYDLDNMIIFPNMYLRDNIIKNENTNNVISINQNIYLSNGIIKLKDNIKIEDIINEINIKTTELNINPLTFSDINSNIKYELEYYDNALLSQFIIFAIVFILALIGVFLSIFTLINKNINKYSVHMMCGAKTNDIIKRINIIIFIIFVLAVSIAIVIVKAMNIFELTATSDIAVSIVFSFIFATFISIVISMFVNILFKKKSINSITKRRE